MDWILIGWFKISLVVRISCFGALTNNVNYREYPGAPDRGGDPDDTENMVKLFADIRTAFKNSGKNYELTFTIPASYWYLRWFDVPGLLQYADWTNLVCFVSLISAGGSCTLTKLV